MPGNFFDSNVLLYLQSPDPWKADRAERALRDGGAISVQVLNEIGSVSLRKFKLSLKCTPFRPDTGASRRA